MPQQEGAKHPGGRPKGKTFDDDQVRELLDKLENGTSLTKACKDPRLPSRSVVYEWVESDPEFAGRFHAARARGVHALAEQCLDIADEPATDAVQVADKRLRIDTRLRLAGKWLAKEYGDRVDVNYNAEVTHRHDLSGLTTDELDALEGLIAKSADAGRDKGGEIAAQSGSLH